MIAVIFEVESNEGRQPDYLDAAARMRDYSLAQRDRAPKDSRQAHG